MTTKANRSIVSVSLPNEVLVRLDAEAERRGISRSKAAAELIAMALLPPLPPLPPAEEIAALKRALKPKGRKLRIEVEDKPEKLAPRQYDPLAKMRKRAR